MIYVTDVAAILGLSAYDTAYDVWLRHQPDYTAPPSTLAKRMGSVMEAELVNEYVRTNNVDTAHVNVATSVSDWLKGAADAVVVTDGMRGLLEIKTTTSWAHRTWDPVPLHYWWQVQIYMHLLKTDWAKLCVYERDTDEYNEYPIEPEPELVADGLLRAKAWHERFILGAEVPERTDLPIQSTAGKQHHADAPLIEIYDELRGLDGVVKNAEPRIEELRNLIKEAMQDAEELYINGVLSATLRTSKTSRVDVKSLPEEIKKQYTITTPTHTLRLVKPKGQKIEI